MFSKKTDKIVLVGVLIARLIAFLAYSFEFPTPPDVKFIVTYVKFGNKYLYIPCSYIHRNEHISTYKKPSFLCGMTGRSIPTDMVPCHVIGLPRLRII